MITDANDGREAEIFNEFMYLFITINRVYFINSKMYDAIVYFYGAKWNLGGGTKPLQAPLIYVSENGSKI